MSGVIAALFAAVFLFGYLHTAGSGRTSVLYVVPLARLARLCYSVAKLRIGSPEQLPPQRCAITFLLLFAAAASRSWLPVINRGICLALFWLTAVVIRRQQDRADHLVRVATIEAENHAHLVKEETLQRQADEIHRSVQPGALRISLLGSNGPVC